MIFAALFSLAIVGQAAEASPASTTHCTGARRNEVCTAEGRAALRAELGLAPVEDEAEAGVEVYRAVYLEGGGGRPTVAFVRRPGHNPAVEVAGTGGQFMTADVPLDVWDRVRDEAVEADRAYIPLPADQTGEACIDGGAVMVEIGAPAVGRRPADVRRRAVSNCVSSPTLKFARLVADLAVARFPACQAIDPETVSDPGVGRLYACFRLKGDQVAAAAVRNRFKGEPGEGTSAAAWRDATGVEAGTRLDWNGDVSEVGAPAGLMARAATLPGLQLGLNEIRGVSSREVRAEGYADAVDGAASRHAAFTQVWRYDDGTRQWRLREWTFGPFQMR